MIKPIIAMILFAGLMSFQVLILRGDFGPNMQRGSRIFWGFDR